MKGCQAWKMLCSSSLFQEVIYLMYWIFFKTWNIFQEALGRHLQTYSVNLGVGLILVGPFRPRTFYDSFKIRIHSRDNLMWCWLELEPCEWPLLCPSFLLYACFFTTDFLQAHNKGPGAEGFDPGFHTSLFPPLSIGSSRLALWLMETTIIWSNSWPSETLGSGKQRSCTDTPITSLIPNSSRR